MTRSAEKELLDFLDHNAFDPVLRAQPEKYPERQRDRLKHVQDATHAEQARYHRYGSASRVIDMFKDDLSSDPARKIHHELEQLGLPTLNGMRGQCEQLARRLGFDGRETD